MLGIRTLQKHTQTEEPKTIKTVGFSGMPLAMVSPGTEVRVNQIYGKPDIKRFLSNLGFVEHAAVTVVSELGGNVIVSVKGSRVAISKAMAARISTV